MLTFFLSQDTISRLRANFAFDLLIDRYEDEYLLRFSKPRRGNQENAPDIEEIRKFWKYLHDIERHNQLLTIRQQNKLPDIPAMSIKDILALI